MSIFPAFGNFDAIGGHRGVTSAIHGHDGQPG
jgi:hypothetical protein